jgi:hypothetical protein
VNREEQIAAAREIRGLLNHEQSDAPVSKPVELTEGFKCSEQERDAAAADYAGRLLDKKTLSPSEQKFLACEISRAIRAQQ